MQDVIVFILVLAILLPLFILMMIKRVRESSSREEAWKSFAEKHRLAFNGRAFTGNFKGTHITVERLFHEPSSAAGPVKLTLNPDKGNVYTLIKIRIGPLPCEIMLEPKDSGFNLPSSPGPLIKTGNAEFDQEFFVYSNNRQSALSFLDPNKQAMLHKRLNECRTWWLHGHDLIFSLPGKYSDEAPLEAKLDELIEFSKQLA